MAENEPKDQNETPEEQPASETPQGSASDDEGSDAQANAPENPEADAPTPSDGEADGDDQSSALAEQALKAAQQAIADMATEADAAAGGGAAGAASGGEEGAGASRFQPPDIEAAVASGDVEGIDLLSDVNLHVKIELGRTRMFVEDVLRLRDGAVVELDKLAGDPVDIYVNDRPVARGEVLILNDNFCVRVNEILAGAKSD